MKDVRIKTTLISVFSKEGLEPIARKLEKLDVKILSTGGTYNYLVDLGVSVEKVEDLTSYPSILDGRVKTLHPKVFGGILARREEDHLSELTKYEIPPIDLVIVDLYPFAQTVAETSEESEIIEKIDIGGISLIRAAAKNFQAVTVISSREQYEELARLLEEKEGVMTLENRKKHARDDFSVSAGYDSEIHQYFAGSGDSAKFSVSSFGEKTLRYGENPHQKGAFYGAVEDVIEQVSGKELSYNNLVDIDAAVQLMSEFQ